jgi:hypothetical protein
MEGKLIRTVIVTSLVTAMVVSGLAYYVGPKIMNRDAAATLQPALYNGPDGSAQSDNYDQPAPRARVRRSSYGAPASSYEQPVYRQPARHHRRARAPPSAHWPAEARARALALSSAAQADCSTIA